jgi:hypothetical protein
LSSPRRIMLRTSLSAIRITRATSAGVSVVRFASIVTPSMTTWGRSKLSTCAPRPAAAAGPLACSSLEDIPTDVERHQGQPDALTQPFVDGQCFELARAAINLVVVRTSRASQSTARALAPDVRRGRPVPRLAFNQQEAAEALGVSVDHFERHIKSHLPVVYSGSRKLYPRTGLERWLDTNTVRPGARAP